MRPPESVVFADANRLLGVDDRVASRRRRLHIAAVVAGTSVPTMSFELVVVGGGNMGAALLSGMVNSGRFDPASLAVVEPVAARREALTQMIPGVHVTGEMPGAVAAVIAVKPPDVVQAAVSAATAGASRLLSIAAGISTATIEAAVGPDVAVVRSMPNTPAIVGLGVSAITAGTAAGDADLVWAESVLGAVGTVVRVDESQFDAVTGLTGSGPAYVFLVAEALVEAGVRAGLERDFVEPMVTQLLVGSAALLAERGDPAALRVMVTSPGGTTAAGLSVLDQRHVVDAFVDAVAAARDRSRELGATPAAENVT
jgi:pyrroline-5-carboxylate reductase